MELPKRTCISCAYLCLLGGVIIPHSYREFAIDDKKWNYGLINYQHVVCHMGKFNIFNKAPEDIRNDIIKQNTCSDWTRFSGISPVAMEQRESSAKSINWAKWAFLISVAILIATILILWFTLKAPNS
jgi:hypothetical protein